MPEIWAVRRVRRILGEGESVDEVEGEGRRGESCEISVKRVWSGSSGSQDSIQGVEGSKAPVVELKAVV